METSAPESRGGAFLGLFAFVLAALAQGVIPYTHTLQFGSSFEVTPRPSTMPLWRDVLNAAGIGLLVCGVAYLAFTACFISLCRAYGEDPVEAGVQARRTALRLGWLYPLFAPMVAPLGLAPMLLLFALPPMEMETMQYVILPVIVVPLFVLLAGAKKTAESVGVSGGWSWLCVLVPVLLAFAVESILLGWPPGGGLIGPWLTALIAGG